MDIISYVMAKSASSAEIAAMIAALPKGIVYRGQVNYQINLPNNPEIGDAYTVKYQGTSGTVSDGREFIWGTYEETNQWIDLGPDLSGELFYCTYGTTTYAEITQALSDGKLPVCIYSDKFYKYDLKSPTNRYTFNASYADALYTISIPVDNSWSAASTQFEIIPNKVTSISSASTNSQYPSAKCVYDALPKMYRHNVSVNGHVISILLPFSDTVDNHHSSLAAGIVGTFVDTPTGLLTGLGYIYWNVDEWEIYDVSNTEIASKATCADTITELV